LTATAQPEFPPGADFAHCIVDRATGRHDQTFEPVRMPAAEIRHMPMVGADHPDFERRVLETDDADP
jgi:hypothetical protein